MVKDQLNKALEPYGLFFAPELSTSDRATIGGMISTDASGQGSCLYGKTSNHVRGLRVVLTDGSDCWSRPVDADQLQDLLSRSDRIGEIYRVLDRIERDRRDLIAATFPKLNRYMTGYDLAHLRMPDGRFDLNAVLCGSEGTLAFVAEAELNLLPIPACAALVNIRYGDFDAALEDARNLVALKVASVETVDEKVLRLAKSDIVWRNIARFFPGDGAGAAGGVNIAEILADDPDELSRKLDDVTSNLERKPLAGRHGYTVARDKRDIDAIWTMRKRAVGLLGNVEGPVRPVAFVEDTAVPPENLARYLREFRRLLDMEGLDYGMYGHADAGVLHVRPALDLTRPEHVAKVRRISDGVVALTRKYGGVLWGEHGKGVRSEYVPAFFGDLYPSLQEIKSVFDPSSQLNPGKIAAPTSGKLKKIDEVVLRGDLDRAIDGEIRAAFDNAAYCNGNGACFARDETMPMCPSYKATLDRRFSPKGRASLMREWLRLLAVQGVAPRAEAQRLRRSRGFGRLFAIAWNTLNPANRSDFSHEVRRAMDTCLACNACAGQCPVKVSVPAFRSKFLELYHGRYLRPLKDPIIAAVELMLPLAALARPIYNAVVGATAGRLLMRLAGLTALPPIPPVSLHREAKRRGVEIATPKRILQLTSAQRARTVVFVPDAFTTYFDPGVILDAIELAAKIGLVPFLSAPCRNGKALHVHGYLGAFERLASKTSRYLDRLAEAGVTLVGLDPAMTLAYRNEYFGALRAPPRARVLLPQEWLVDNLDRLDPIRGAGEGKAFKLMGHCTERTNAPAAESQWSAVFAKLGVPLVALEVGCCGMAGTFGHEVRNRALSQQIYEMSWEPEIKAADQGVELSATGYSCRSQVLRTSLRSIPHPIQIVNALTGDKSRHRQVE